MHWQSLLAGLAIVGVAIVGGGAAVGLAGGLGTPQVVATVVLVAVALVGAVLLGHHSLSRTSTPYW